LKCIPSLPDQEYSTKLQNKALITSAGFTENPMIKILNIKNQKKKSKGSEASGTIDNKPNNMSINRPEDFIHHPSKKK